MFVDDENEGLITGLEAFRRPQTLCMLSVCITMMLTTIGTFWMKTLVDTGVTYKMHAWCLRGLDTEGVIVHETYWPFVCIGLLASGIGAVSAYQVFRCDSRPTQMVVGIVNSFLIIALVYGTYYLCVYLDQHIAPEIVSEHSKEVPLTFAAALGFNSLALLLMMRDERLIKTVGRLRRVS